MNANQVLDRHFLEVRAKLLEIAATLDRIDRADSTLDSDDPRIEKLRSGLRVLLTSSTSDRAEQIQQVFSRPYESQWRTEFDI